MDAPTLPWKRPPGCRHEHMDDYLDWELPGERGKPEPLLIRDLEAPDPDRRQRAKECVLRNEVANHCGVNIERVTLDLSCFGRRVTVNGRDGQPIEAIIVD